MHVIFVYWGLWVHVCVYVCVCVLWRREGTLSQNKKTGTLTVKERVSCMLRGIKLYKIVCLQVIPKSSGS